MPDTHNTAEAAERFTDLKVVGNPDSFKLICKASSRNEGWSKSTKALDLKNGVLVQVSTEWRFGDKVAVAEALQFIPDISVVADGAGGYKLA